MGRVKPISPARTDRYNLMINTVFEKCFKELCEKYITGRLIDIGCGEKPYKHLLEGLVTDHVGIDHCGTSHDRSNIDIIGTAYSIPVESNSFDSVICTAVLEHLEEPELAIKECYRVLKTGGYAVYSVPFIWHLHEEPRDFFRFSKYGLKYLFEKTGFAVVEIRPLSGFILTFLQLHIYLVMGKFNKGIIRFLGIFELYNFIIQRLGIFLNKFDRSYAWTWMNVVVAHK
jgi:SAM-dependent methyltransferase